MNPEQNKQEVDYVPATELAEAQAKIVEVKQQTEKRKNRGMAILALAGTLLGIGGTKAVEAATTPPEMSNQTVTVEPGDTEWAIAERLAPAADPRDTIHELEATNKDLSAAVYPRETIHIPVDLAPADKTEDKE